MFAFVIGLPLIVMLRLSIYFFLLLACVSALPATLFAALEEEEDLNILDALEATLFEVCSCFAMNSAF